MGDTELKKISEIIIIIIALSLIVSTISFFSLKYYYEKKTYDYPVYDENKTYEITLYNNNNRIVTFYVTKQINIIINNLGKEKIVSIYDPTKSTHINLEKYGLMEVKEFKNGN